MKSVFFILIGTIFLMGCDEDEGIPVFEGSESDLTDLFNGAVVDALVELNFTINEGPNPPDLEGTFFVSPAILTDTNVPGDNIGVRFFDQQYEFLNQDNATNTIDFEGEQLNLSGTVESVLDGAGSFISGSGNAFSIFLIITDEVLANGGMAEVAFCISGIISEGGISNTEFAVITLDDFGDEFNQFIEIGQGRRFVDEDGFSPELATEETALKIKASAQSAPMGFMTQSNK